MVFEVTATPGVFEEGDVVKPTGAWAARVLGRFDSNEYVDLVVRINESKWVMLMRFGPHWMVTANDIVKGEYWLYSPREDDDEVAVLVGGQPRAVARGCLLAADEALDAFERTLRSRAAPFDEHWREL